MSAVPSLLAITGIVTWTLALMRAFFVIVTVSQGREDLWLLDWHVYAAAAGDLVHRTLYRIPLDYPGWPLPVEQFNLPPLAAVWALPFAWLPGELGGVLWLGLGLLMWLGAWWFIAARILRIRYAWVVIGVALAVYSRFFAFDIHVSVGNINDLMLGLLGGFIILHVAGRSREAGILLGLAVATKLWPVVLGVILVREQRWRELGWAGGVATAGIVVPLAWLGPDSAGSMIHALKPTVAVTANNPVLWTTWLRESFSWWPAAAAVIVAALLLAVPARGHLGLGLGIVAGLTLIPNLWGHYLPTLLVGIVLVVVGGARRSVMPPRAISCDGSDDGERRCGDRSDDHDAKAR